MILQALTRYYEDLLQRGEIAAPGWSPAKISFALCLDKDGQVTQVIPTMEAVTMGKKTVLRPQSMILPSAVKKTSNAHLLSNFLWEDSSHFLGIDQKGNIKRSMIAFSTAASLHHTVLDGVDSPAAKAILAFFDTWQPEKAMEHPALSGQYEAVTAGGNLLFRVDGHYVHEDATIREVWQRYRDGADEDAVRMQCLVTGCEDEITATHPAIKGVRDAQSSGAALVSFNAPAFCSYGREQNYNAPVGKYAAFAYTAALNHLLAKRDNVQVIGDTTIVCWAEGAEPVYQDVFMSFMSDKMPSTISDNDLRAALKNLAKGRPCEELGVDPNRTFYILGLAPNAARLSVRFFLRDSFGRLMRNVNDHYERLEIVKPAYAKPGVLSLWALLRETVRDPKKQVPSPAMAGATARAVFSGGLYPASLLEAVMLRIRAERDVTWGRAAIIKAYLKRKYADRIDAEHHYISEVTGMKLNDACNYMPYVLGRLFRVMEEIQLASADWSLNRSIKDSYFNAAASTPKSAFSKLFPLNEYHAKKLLRDKPGLGRKLNEEKGALSARITESIPARFTQEESNCFYLGYYHQQYTKKEERKNV